MSPELEPDDPNPSSLTGDAVDGIPDDLTASPLLWEKLKSYYLAEYPQRGADVFARERPILEPALRDITAAENKRYRTEGVLGLGAVGVVFLMFDTRLCPASVEM